jgi:ATPase family associated with various cellular activities (AAA)
MSWRETVFILGERLFFTLSGSMGGERELEVWAKSPGMALAQLERFKSLYLLPEEKRPDVAQFFVLTVSHRGIEGRRITLPPPNLNQQELELHYGREFCHWNRWFQKKLDHAKTGLTILQGEPGTGKTSYLRHLVYQLRASHCFYYLPVTAYPMLAAPSTVDFWLAENEFHGEKQKIAIMEDAETLLMERASDNHESLSNLLNIADGFLGTFLKLHVICTVNAPIERLDPAVTRPGRLLANYTFKRLSPQQGQLLAKAKGLTIPDQESYSLAEIYGQDKQTSLLESGRSVGFAHVKNG